ncbi:MAG: hypothetical protein DDG60_10135 [Anaerolineae bacterium]|nr:MAG: hypothetical protein DDG60_10135 [Anaerolineae bacterium]
MRKLPGHGACFVCGAENPHSIGLTWFEENGEIFAEFTFNEGQQGPPAHLHGGASAAVLDEAMGAAVWVAGLRVVAVNLEINYKQPVPLGQRVTIHARIQERHERKVLTTSELRLADSTVAVTGRGIYVPAPHLVGTEKVKFQH